MRLYELTIHAFDRKMNELLGDDMDRDIPAKCIVDLDEVESMWQSPAEDKAVCVRMKSGDSYWSYGQPLDVLLAVWQGEDLVKRVWKNDLEKGEV